MVSSVEATLGTVNPAALDLDDWLKRICQHQSLSDQKLLRQAFKLAGESYWEQSRPTGESSLLHACSVVDILNDLHMDCETLVAALLHNAVENREAGPDLDAVRKQFNERIAHLIEGSLKMRFMYDLPLTSEVNAPGNPQNQQAQAESVRKMLLAVVEDVRVVLIKLAERLQEMRMLKYLPLEQQRKMASETLEIFTPLANRLGVWQIKWELEDLALRYLEPETYQRLAGLLDEKRTDRERYVQKIIETLETLLKEAGINAEIYGRAKHIYSIWRKMQRKGVDFHQVFDVLAVRVLVDDLGACYSTLGMVHSLWQPIPGEFDDYIARPKNNNYRSLHTAVGGPDGRIFEVQIRTHDMHRQAELGVAAHWRYKEGGGKRDAAFEEKIAWLRQLLEWKDEDGEESSRDFLDRFKSELFEEHVYALSPQGRIVDLPQSATPLDFAYAIHTSLGHRCRGAKINGRIVPLTYQLKTGEQVEIISGKDEKPSHNWLTEGYVKTSRARNKIRHWLKQQDLAKHLAEGRNLLERELRRLNVNDLDWQQLAQRLHFQTQDELLANLGRGEIGMASVANAIRELILPESREERDQLTISESRGGDRASGLEIDGLDGLLSHAAACCKPVPGEPVIGYITREKGIAIHRRDCPNVRRWEEEGNARLIEVQWSKRQGVVHPVEIIIRAYDRTGLLRDISDTLSGEKINIIAVQTRTEQDQIAHMQLTLEVHDVSQLSRTLQRIEQLSNVFEVMRRKS